MSLPLACRTMMPRVHRIFRAALPLAVLLCAGGARFLTADDTASKAGDVLSFKNNDKLNGNLVTMSSKGGVKWRHPGSPDELSFPLASLREITLKQGDESRIRHRTRVVLTNGDQLVGDLVSIDKDNVLLDTWYAGRVTIKRSMAERLMHDPVPGKKNSVIFAGPTSKDGWTEAAALNRALGDGAKWTYADGALSTDTPGAIIGRDVKLPDSSVTEFDLTLQPPAGVMVLLYADLPKAADPTQGNFYSLQLGFPSGVTLRRSQSGSTRTLPRQAGGGNNAVVLKPDTRLELRVDKSTKSFTLLANGSIAGRWNDTASFAGTGTGLQFVSVANGAVKISSIIVRHWDGEEAQRKLPRTPSDQIQVADSGDKVSGTLDSIEGGQLTLSTPYGALKMPYEHVTEICLSSKDSGVAKAVSNNVEVKLADGGAVSLDMERVSDRRVVGTSENFGRIAIQLDAIRSLRLQKESSSSIEGWEDEEPVADGGEVEEGTDLVRFKNGNRVHGHLTGTAPGQLLRWKFDGAPTPVSFQQDAIESVSLGRKVPARPAAGDRIEVTLTNGDTLAGNNAALTSTELTLTTLGAGTLTIPRNHLQKIEPRAREAAPVFEGPASLKGWKTNPDARGKWVYKDGALYSTGTATIGCDMKLPEVARIDFDWVWRGTSPYLQLGFYSDRTEINTGSANHYVLQVSSTSVYLRRCSLNGNAGMQRTVGDGQRINVAALLKQAGTHMTLLVSKPEKTISLLMDGTLVKEWKDNPDFAGKGTNVIFSTNDRSPTRISNIVIAHWDGALGSAPGPRADAKEDVVRFVNGDTLAGKVTGIVDGQLQLANDVGPLKVPLDRVVSVRFAGAEARTQKLKPGHVRVSLGTEGIATLALDTLDGRTLSGTSDIFGKASLLLESIRQIEW